MHRCLVFFTTGEALHYTLISDPATVWMSSSVKKAGESTAHSTSVPGGCLTPPGFGVLGAGVGGGDYYDHYTGEEGEEEHWDHQEDYSAVPPSAAWEEEAEAEELAGDSSLLRALHNMWRMLVQFVRTGHFELYVPASGTSPPLPLSLLFFLLGRVRVRVRFKVRGRALAYPPPPARPPHASSAPSFGRCQCHDCALHPLGTDG